MNQASWQSIKHHTPYCCVSRIKVSPCSVYPKEPHRKRDTANFITYISDVHIGVSKMVLTSEQMALIVVVFIAIAGVWLTILTYLIVSRKRRKPEQLVEEIKKSLQDDKEKAKIMPLLNEMIESETDKGRKRKIKTIKKKAKKVDVSDINDLMSELTSIISECGEENTMEAAPPPSP